MLFVPVIACRSHVLYVYGTTKRYDSTASINDVLQILHRRREPIQKHNNSCTCIQLAYNPTLKIRWRVRATCSIFFSILFHRKASENQVEHDTQDMHVFVCVRISFHITIRTRLIVFVYTLSMCVSNGKFRLCMSALVLFLLIWKMYGFHTSLSRLFQLDG